MAELNDSFGVEIAGCEPERAKAEVVQGLKKAIDVVRCRAHPEVDIAGVARVACAANA